MLKTFCLRYQNEIVGFGFKYQPALHLSELILMYGAVLAFAYFFQMNIYYLVLSLICLSFLFPVLLYLICEYGYEEKEFSQFTNFLMHVGSSFKQHPKILNALKECRELTMGDFRKYLDEAIKLLEEGDDYEVALKNLLSKYHYYLFDNLVNLMISVESYGASTYEAGINLIQEDLDDVIEDMYMYQHNLMSLRIKVFILCGLSIVVSLFCNQMMSELYDFHHDGVYQLMLFIYVLTLFVSISASQLFLRHTWRIWQ